MVTNPVRSAWVVALVVCLLATAGATSATALAVTAVPEAEPNDTPLDANPIEAGVGVTGTITYDPLTGWIDNDYFEVYATAGSEIDVEFSRSGGSGSLYVAIGTKTSSEAMDWTVVEPGGHQTVQIVAPRDTLYLVYVTGSPGYLVPGGSYVLTVRADANAGTTERPTPTATPPEIPTPASPSPAPLPASDPDPLPGPSAAGLLAASLVGFLFGILTGNAENEKTRNVVIGLFTFFFLGGGAISQLERSPGLRWLVIAWGLGVLMGLLVGTRVRDAGLTYAP